MMEREGEGVWVITLEVFVMRAVFSTSINFWTKNLHTPILINKLMTRDRYC